MEIRTLQVNPENAGERLDAFLAEQLEDVTRSAAAKLCAGGSVTREGKPLAKNYRLTGGETIDVAFVPLDPRLGENFWRGADYLLRTADVRTLIPMHTWGEYTMAARLREKEGGSRCRILDLTGPGQIFELEENA